MNSRIIYDKNGSGMLEAFPDAMMKSGIIDYRVWRAVGKRIGKPKYFRGKEIFNNMNPCSEIALPMRGICNLGRRKRYPRMGSVGKESRAFYNVLRRLEDGHPRSSS